MKKKILVTLLIAVFTTLFVTCKKDEIEIFQTNISDDFESGNIGEVNMLSNTHWQIQLANDNDTPDLPERWRNWWYIKMENVVTDLTTEIQL